jgi:hypothetical protein
MMISGGAKGAQRPGGLGGRSPPRPRETHADDGRMETSDKRIVESMRLRCQECDHVSDEAARGWRTFLAPDPDEPEAAPIVATYCPPCAAREFGLSIGAASRPTGHAD